MRKAQRPRARAAVRPTSGRVRDAIFNSLGKRVVGARVLDLFAGTGELGIEALRHRAERAVFVESDARMAGMIRQRLTEEEHADRAEVWRRDALSAVRELGNSGRQFDLILMDPPYGKGWIPRTLQAVRSSRILAPGGTIVAEGHWRDRPAPGEALICIHEGRYGETAVWYFQHAEGGTQR